MDDLPPSRSLRLILGCLLVFLLWGEAGSIAEEVRSESPSSHVLARAQTLRSAAGRISFDLTDSFALPEPRLAAEGAVARATLPQTVVAECPLQGRQETRLHLPRAPPPT